jgi:hypothetical protein
VLALTAVAVVCVAGCGGHGNRPEPQLAKRDATELTSLARKVARDAPTHGCAARREIAALSAKAHALVAAGRVPLRLRAPLLAGVAGLVADAPACTSPAPAPAPAPAPVEKHGKGHQKDHGHGHGHGHDKD